MARTQEEREVDRIMKDFRRGADEINKIFERAGVKTKQRQR